MGTLATTPRACFCFLQQPPLSRETKTSATTKITMPTTLSEQDYKAKHVHYDHQDLCKDLRWTAKESYEYLYNRPWKDIQNFYSHLLAGHLSLNDLVFHRKAEVTRTCVTPLSTSSANGTCTENHVKKDRGGKWDRRTFKILLSYDGSYFDGWQKQPGLNSVQGLLEKTLGKFVGNKKVKELEAKGIPIEAAISVAGRTDKGVSALHQVCSFYTWRKDVTALEVEAEINALASECLKVASVYEVPREFHPNFSAKWRRYLYILPLHEGEGDGMCNSTKEILKMEKVSATAESECKQLNKPYNFDVALVSQFLQQLEGRSLSYKIFARDTQASRSSGPATECTMYHARAAVATLPCIGKHDGHRTKNVMCVELVANRFLRKMVRVLVATAVREAAAGADPNIFLNLMEATCRRASAPPAPPDGLCLVDVGYEDINNENSIFLIN